MKKFKGTGVAVVTPFKNDLSIDFAAMGRIIDHLIAGGVNYIVVLGTTGEPSTLNKDEKNALTSYVAEAINKRVPLVVGIGGNNTSELVSFIRHADFEGVDAILSVSPYYNKPSQRGLYQHYRQIAAASPVPVILYNVPSRTCSSLMPETVLELAKDCENIIGIKEASGSFENVMKILKDKPEDFFVISGNDMDILPVIAAGGTGVISVLANAYPAEWSEMVNQALKHNFKIAREIQFKFLEMIELLFADGSPAGVKAMMSSMNLCQNTLRLPLVTVNRSVQSRIQKAMEALNRGV
ncbi:MAG TPA: 4-hydroxy-tetrahydrodipicolinate synthase [Bacteroidales bacterium]|nr:4-hydroxy-tetrahydrodipicolinate synthase [Bacteroidales bacterium]